MEAKIIQEFKGILNNVLIENEKLYYCIEYILSKIEDKFDLKKFVSSGKYSINGNLKVSALDYWNFLNLQCKPDIFLSYFNLRYNILGEFTVKPSERINKFGDFKFDLSKNWDI